MGRGCGKGRSQGSHAGDGAPDDNDARWHIVFKRLDELSTMCSVVLEFVLRCLSDGLPAVVGQLPAQQSTPGPAAAPPGPPTTPTPLCPPPPPATPKPAATQMQTEPAAQTHSQSLQHCQCDQGLQQRRRRNRCQRRNQGRQQHC